MTVVFWASTVIKRTWKECLSAEDADLALNVRIDDDDDEDGMDIDEFNHLNFSGGDDMIADKDLFVLAEDEEEELNVFDGSANALLT